MADLEHYHTFVRYNTWANRRAAAMLAALTENQLPWPLLLFSHLLRAEKVWLDRIQGSQEAKLELWETDTLGGCRERIESNATGFAAVLEALGPATLEQPVRYTNTKGALYGTPLSGIFDHVFNHSTHHRGQLALLVRDAGEVPQPLDLIAYLRGAR